MSTAAAFQVDATTIDMEMEGLGHIAELASAAGSTPAPSIHVQRARALWAVSCLTLAADMSAGLFQPARGPVFGRHSTAYYSVLAAILAIVAVEMTVAYRLPRRSCAQDEEDDRGRVLAFANGLLRFGVVLLLVMVAVGGFALTVKL